MLESTGRSLAVPLAIALLGGCSGDDVTAGIDDSQTAAIDSSSGDGDGDGDPGDGDGDGDPGDGDGDGDGDPGDGDGDGECGNGSVEADEACDDGNATNDDACTNECTQPACGDGIIQAGEGCDTGADNGPGKPCNSMCQPNVCGDAEIGPGESCDDGNLNDDDACGNDCALPTCGDAQLDPGEQCDDGNLANDDECLDTCVSASCGDGLLFPEQESCDQGEFNSDTAQCTAACELATCGDGLVWADMEACDLGLANGPMSSCLESCALNVCGDGAPGPQEGCDDGNLNDNDGCSANCNPEGCGDGIMQLGEECDDGNITQTDACTTSCTLAACGDGYLQIGEQCDDGMQNANTAACTLACVIAECGDGFVHAQVEQCDDGNLSNDDGCSASCVSEEDVGQVVTSPRTTCVLLSGGHVRCWGDNTWGQLGRGNTIRLGDNPGELPVPDIPLGAGVVQITAGFDHACALHDDGTVRCWGRTAFVLGYPNTPGNIGDEPGEMPPPPVQLGGVAQQIEAGYEFTCALMEGGVVRCWGRGTRGQLGNGSSTTVGNEPSDMPPANTNVGGPVAEIATGFDFACARLVNGNVRCWGSNTSGQLGNGIIEDVGDDPGEMPPPDVDLGGATVVDICAGGPSICVLIDDGTVRCWGRGNAGQLGQENLDHIGDNPGEMPPPPVDVGGTVVQLMMADTHACALLQSGALRCWGNGGSGRLGTESSVDVGGYPDQMPPVDTDAGTVVKLATDGGDVSNHTCVFVQGGALRCWGYNAYGQLGLGNTTSLGNLPGHMPPPDVPID